MKSPTNPYSSVWSEDIIAQTNPTPIKIVFFFPGIHTIPSPLIYGNHFPRLAGDSIVAQKIWRICKHHIYRTGNYLFKKRKSIPV